MLVGGPVKNLFKEVLRFGQSLNNKVVIKHPPPHTLSNYMWRNQTVAPPLGKYSMTVSSFKTMGCLGNTGPDESSGARETLFVTALHSGQETRIQNRDHPPIKADENGLY